MVGKRHQHTHLTGPNDVPKEDKRYRVVAISLYASEAAKTDRVTEILQRAGWPRANRSFVIREALSCLLDEVADKEPEEVFQYFLDRQGRRAMRRTKRP